MIRHSNTRHLPVDPRAAPYPKSRRHVCSVCDFACHTKGKGLDHS